MTVTLALDTSMIPDTGAGWGMVGAWLGALLLRLV